MRWSFTPPYNCAVRGSSLTRRQYVEANLAESRAIRENAGAGFSKYAQNEREIVVGAERNVAGKATENGLSPGNYPNPDPAMTLPPVRYEPTTIEEVLRMREGKVPIGKTIGGDWIEAHHRQQVPIEEGGIIDELWWRTHRGAGNHSRHSQPSRLTSQQRSLEIKKYYEKRGADYMTGDGEGV